MDAGRFQRLHEPRSEPKRDDIVRPESLAAPAGEADRPRIGERLAIEVGKQDRGRLVVREELAAIDVAVAGAMLERNPPLPPGLSRHRLRIGSEGVARLAWDRERGVAREPLAPVDV